MRDRLAELGVPCPRWAQARTAADVDGLRRRRSAGRSCQDAPRRLRRQGRPRRRRPPTSSTDWLERVGDAGARLGDGLLLEEKVDFGRELAALVARSPSGQAAAYPVVETVQPDGICTEVLAPAPDLDAGPGRRCATEAALRIAGELGVTGVLAVELFEIAMPRRAPGVLVNELAMRPHNTGHWTHGRRGHLPVRAPPARRARPAARVARGRARRGR